MSRSGYSEDFDERFPNALALYRQRVENAIRGKRGQAFLRELGATLDAMLVKELAANTVVSGTGEAKACALGCVAIARNLNLAPITCTEEGEEDDGDWTTEWLRDQLGIVDCLAREIVFENDEGSLRDETPAARWRRMRMWVAEQLGQQAPAEALA